MYHAWLVHIMPLVSPTNTVAIILKSFFVLYFYVRTWRSDPGTIHSSREEKIKALVEVVESEGGLPQETFCTSCLVRRPERSKHCAVCNRCVLSFDHHCPFTGNCVGEANHRPFLAWLLLLAPILVWCLWGLLTALTAPPHPSGGILETGWALAREQPWLAFMAALVGLNLPWVIILTCCQIYQVSCLAMTTNERMNVVRYTRFHTGVPGKYRSPYDQGWWRNFWSFWGVKMRQFSGKGDDRRSLLGLYQV